MDKAIDFVSARLFSDAIYQDFDPLPELVDGWEGDDPIFEELILRTKPTIIVEVGTWLGMSAFTMAEVCKRENLNAVVICVDTWLGSAEHFEEYRAELAPKNGYPTLYNQFLSNVVHRGLQDYVVPLPMASSEAAQVLTNVGIEADLIYIDGGHHFQSVSLDLALFYPVLKPNGVLFGHDYDWGEIATAVGMFGQKTGLNHSTTRRFWIYDNKPADATP